MSTLSVATIKSASSASPVFQNSSGTEKGQLCKAWVNFNGSGTVSIVGSFNMSSITDQGTGQYRLTYTNAMPNDDYCAAMMPRGNSVTAGVYEQADLATTHLDFQSRNGSGGLTDREIFGFAVFCSD
tara:strand:- start:634 stop:1014 length:381 start_codon:yes stop_codon:yes gene_type:complete